MTDSSGAVVWKARYKTFGEAQVDSSSTITNNFRFPGQYYDAETGLHYNYHRYYDPSTGRYVSADPIGLIGGINLFIYAANAPVKKKDLMGLFEWVNPIDYWSDFWGGAGDMFGGWSDMIDAGTIGADAYFHCRANCDASKRGLGGYHAAKFMSWIRETIQNEAPADRVKDENANVQGQCAGRNNPIADCYRACSNLIPLWGIPLRHLPPNADPAHIYNPKPRR